MITKNVFFKILIFDLKTEAKKTDWGVSFPSESMQTKYIWDAGKTLKRHWIYWMKGTTGWLCACSDIWKTEKRLCKLHLTRIWTVNSIGRTGHVKIDRAGTRLSIYRISCEIIILWNRSDRPKQNCPGNGYPVPNPN